MSGLNPNVVVGTCLLSVLWVGCGSDEEAAAPPLTRPVKTFFVEGGIADALRSFPGRVDASQRAELSFRVAGQLQQILVKEGDVVDAGQVLARLDPADYQLVYEDKKATFDNTQRNFERAKELVGDGNISRMDYDTMEANFRSASAALSQAEKDLEYTVLTSPFEGRVAARMAENFEEVSAKQDIFSLQNTSKLDIIIDVPESVVRMVRDIDVDINSPDSSITTGESITETRAWALFEGRSAERFPLKPKETATKANAQTQTFKVTFSMGAPTNFTVLPGMTAMVELDLSRFVHEDSVRRVPVRAVQGDRGLKSRVWILDPEAMTVSQREVTIGRMTGDMIQVTDGLDGGEEIISVGAPYLAEGMLVTRMKMTEQAVPRADDPL